MIAASNFHRQAVLALLVLVLVGSTLPYGGVRPWTVALLVLAIALGSLGTLLGDGVEEGLERTLPITLCLVGIGLLGWTQASIPGLSLAPSLSRGAGTGWVTLALLAVCTGLACQLRRGRGTLFVAFVTAVVFQLIYGLRAIVSESPLIWGRIVEGPIHRLRGTYVNSDHAAVLFEIALAVGLAWVWWAWQRSGSRPSLERLAAYMLPPAFFVCLTLVGVFLTGSRAGLGAACLILVGAILAVGGVRKWWVAALAAAGIGLTLVTLVLLKPSSPWARPIARPLYEVLHTERLEVTRASVVLWREHPILGTGLGTFEEAFPRVQPQHLVGTRWGRAHNDFAELLVTGGLCGLGLLLCASGLLVRRLLVVRRSGVRSLGRAAAIAALCAIPGLVFHELLDFGLTVPANAIAVTMLFAIAASSTTASEAGAEPWRERSAASRLNRS